MAFLATTNQAYAQDDKPQLQTIPVTEGIYMLKTEQAGNIGVSVGEDGVFLIDDQLAPMTEQIRTAVSAISNQPIRFILNTHWHFDHTGGNENFGRAGVVIVAHDNVRQRMKVDHFIEALNMEIPASPSVALPVITFNDRATFHLNDDEIQAFHVDPAHTDGDSIIHFQEADVIHAGDIYFNGIYPFIDLSSGGSIEGMIAAVEKILAMAGEQTKIIPGHGPLSTRAELVAYRDILVTVRDQVKAAIAQSISLEDFIASKPTKDFDATWGKGFLTPEQFLTIVYTDLSR
ncbi:MAG: MBL fold metallo-hydrolase [Symploca sp. SIO3E6]|nr:MBL fold metallo-hydrolase [Caldora sp. SIO3E6]